MANVTKGWFAEGLVLRDDGSIGGKKRSRLFHSIDAANAYADAMRNSGAYAPTAS